MKNLSVFSTVLVAWALSFTAQGQEIDDMYFNSKDRAKLNDRRITADLALTRKTNDLAETPTLINPTDSYSARNVNPEYAAQLNTSKTSAIEQEYFLPDFQPTGVNQNLANCNCNPNSFYNPYFGNNAFNNPYYGSMGGFGSPFGGFYPNAWGYPSHGFGGFRPGLSMSMGLGFGGFNSGFNNGLGFGHGNFWNPYNNFNSWGGGGFWGGYPTQVVVINNSDSFGRRTVQSKRGSRSSNVNQVATYARPRNANTSAATPTRSTSSGGRTTSAPEYYDRGWKRDQNTNTTRSTWNNPNNNAGNSSRSDFNWGNSGGRQNSSGFNASPSRSSFNNSGGTRSGSTGGSQSGTRGRNN